jgi:hypothetical protein
MMGLAKQAQMEQGIDSHLSSNFSFTTLSFFF